MKRIQLLKIAPCLIASLIFLHIIGCTTVPETGRKQFIIISPSQEMQLGLTSFTKMKTEMPVSKNKQANEMLQRVGKRISAVADLPNAQWEFVLFESEQINAFCLPGGKVGVYTGILPITKDENGLATVIGHEVAHATARHGAARISEALVIQLGGELLNVALSRTKMEQERQEYARLAYGMGTKLGRELPHSREQELEADYLGLLYMARAGYDPEEALRFWERFAAFNKKRGSSTPWFLRTHPLDEKRIQDIRMSVTAVKQVEYRPSTGN
jgi:metalloendopeptidase OMA1, mitochondrial